MKKDESLSRSVQVFRCLGEDDALKFSCILWKNLPQEDCADQYPGTRTFPSFAGPTLERITPAARPVSAMIPTGERKREAPPRNEGCIHSLGRRQSPSLGGKTGRRRVGSFRPRYSGQSRGGHGAPAHIHPLISVKTPRMRFHFIRRGILLKSHALLSGMRNAILPLDLSGT
jgi:hypothetical protein